MMDRKKRKSRIVLAFLTSLCVLLQMTFAGTAVFAKEKTDVAESSQNGGYKYKVTFYSGNEGTFGDGATVTEQTVSIGERAIFDIGDVKPKDDKHYVKGIRKSGRDNNDKTGAVEASAITVTEDVEYVVAYGIKGDMVAYTVNYRDENGNALAESRTYYGNVGDKPVVAYRYIEGYQPQSYNLTKTLAKNEAENVFTFEYRQNPQAETPTAEGPAAEEPTTAPTPGGGATPAAIGGTTPGGVAAPADGGGTGGTTTDGGAAAPGAGPAAAAPAAAPAAPLTTVPDDAVPAAQEPDNLTDLDDEDVPLANQDLKDKKKQKLQYALAAAGLGILAAGGGLLVWLRRKKRKAQEAAAMASMGETDDGADNE